MELECYPTSTELLPKIVPGRPQRAWMDAFADRHAYRCLPLTMANSTGWELLCPAGFSVTWTGGMAQEDITFQPDAGFNRMDHLARSHFSHGIMTFHPGYLFKTPPGWSMWAMGPPNHIKDGIQPLAGLVETDWLPFPFTMNWHFTRPGTVRFEKGEPFCFITLQQDKVMEDVDIVQRSLANNPELNEQYVAWFKERDQFNKRIFAHEPVATKEAWQRFYFRGQLPEEAGGDAPKKHVNNRRLKARRIIP
ncbi:DUF6065 family protein [soil metagenome]